MTFVNWGIIPMDRTSPRTGEVILTSHHRLIDHRREDGIDGLISLIGVKYTTGRGVAEKAVDLTFRLLGRKPPRCPIPEKRLAGGNIECFEEFREDLIEKKPRGLPIEVLDNIARNYGSENNKILDLIARDNSLGQTLPGSDEIIGAAAIHAVREEMACKLADVVLRRTDLGSAGHPGMKAIEACDDIMAGELGWSSTRKQSEIREVEAVYQPGK